MATFSDLMSLLMCFFVMLVSMSEMNAEKFRQIAGSMQYALGVQNQLQVKDIPIGTSIIAHEFAPGRPEPTPIEVIMQVTRHHDKQFLEFQNGPLDKAVGNPTVSNIENAESTQQGISEKDASQLAEWEEYLAQNLRQEIENDELEVVEKGQQLVIRFKEKGAFPKGSAFVQPKFHNLIEKVGDVVTKLPGEITLYGHTDNSKVYGDLYSSPWDLSIQRANSVAEVMFARHRLDEDRLRIVGYGDTHPLLPNDTSAHRSANRRVEIGIKQGKPHHAIIDLAGKKVTGKVS